MSGGRITALIIGAIGMTQTFRHDLGLGVQGVIGIASIALIFYAIGLTGSN